MDPSVKKAARSILKVFRDRGVGSGGFVNFADFGKAIHWEAGHVKHENQREGLRYLVENGYVDQTNTGLELTAKGEKALPGI